MAVDCSRRNSRLLVLFLTPASLVYIEWTRLSGDSPPVYLLMLFGTVAISAGLAGMCLGLLSGTCLAGYLVYSTLASFGPPTLTGSPIRLVLGCMVVFATAIVLGRIRDRNAALISALRDAERSLEKSREELEEMVEVRTKQLAESNRRLSESEDRLKRAQRIANIGCWDWNIVTNNLWWSDEIYRIFDIDPEEFRSTYEAFLERVHPEDRRLVTDAVRKALNNNEHYSTDHRIVLRNGTEKTVHEQAEVTYDAGGHPVRMIGTVRDITARVNEEKKLRQALHEIGKLRDRLEEENVRLREEVRSVKEFEQIIGDSEMLRNCLDLVAKAAPTDAAVLILGETGTGKELVAKAIHELSSRRDKRLVSLNCTALPAELVESELFGHEPGAFTGACSRRQGRFELADGGTLFLDEVGDLPISLQGKLLRVLEDGTFERLGGTQTIRVNVRLLAATNRDLGEAIKNGEFRADLYYRISTVPVELPPLRDRKVDIPALAQHFVAKHGPRLRKSVQYVSSNMLRYLQEQDWPGNVRELEHFIERSLICSRGDTLTLADSELPRVQASFSSPVEASDAGADLRSVERSHIINVLEGTRWTICGEGGAAAILRLPPSTLRSKMKRLGIQRSK